MPISEGRETPILSSVPNNGKLESILALSVQGLKPGIRCYFRKGLKCVQGQHSMLLVAMEDLNFVPGV